MCVLCYLWMLSIQNWRVNSLWKEYCLYLLLPVPLFSSRLSSPYSSSYLASCPSPPPPCSSLLPPLFFLFVWLSVLYCGFAVFLFKSTEAKDFGRQSPKTLYRLFKFFDFCSCLPFHPKLPWSPPHNTHTVYPLRSISLHFLTYGLHVSASKWEFMDPPQGWLLVLHLLQSTVYSPVPMRLLHYALLGAPGR